jgi:hypothetical protein
MNQKLVCSMKLLILILITGVSLQSIAQTEKFVRKAELPEVKQSGFYNILLEPTITSHLKGDLSDIRIYNQDKEVPYILTSETSSSSTAFHEYKIIDNKSVSKWTRLILQNASKSEINNISLLIKNSDVKKKARLSGSDDQTNWYIIKDNYNLEAVYSTHNTAEVKILDFPLSDYEYYKLEIEDSLSAPIKILKAGFYDTRFEEAKYLTLPSSSVTQRDSSDKNTYIKVSFGSPQMIDRLKIEIKNPEYFLRKIQLAKLIKDKKINYWETIQKDELKSNNDNTIMLDHLFTDHFYIIIENNDNLPLKIGSIKGYQLTHYLTAQLDAGQSYVLKFGNKEISYPTYDLEFFRDSLPNSIPLLKATNVTNINSLQPKDKRDDFFKSTIWIWLAIAAIISFLGYMSYRMLKEMK